MPNPFWKTKTLAEMDQSEWESLCDGCGFCCLIKLEDDDTGEIFNTSVACRLLDIETCRCSDYANRFDKVPGCLKLSVDNVAGLDWLPATCAYRLIAAGEDLPEWHPLQDTSHSLSRVSVSGFAQSEQYVHPDQLHECIID